MLTGLNHVVYKRHESLKDYKKVCFRIKHYDSNNYTISVKHGVVPHFEEVEFNGLKRVKRRVLFEDDVIDIENCKRSSNRIKGVLMDLTLCNTFDWFVTLTFANTDNLDRYDDDMTREAFQNWESYMHTLYPDLRYIAVPEYHKKGGLHYHLLVGGVTADELQLVPAQLQLDDGTVVPLKEYSKFLNDYDVVYNIGAWHLGFSTCTKIHSYAACKNYILKYVVKGSPDPRFFNKHRYSCSQNLNRPIENTYSDYCALFDPTEVYDLYAVDPVFFDPKHNVYKYESTGFNFY